MYSLNAVFGEGNRFDSVIDQFYNQLNDENRYNKTMATFGLISKALFEGVQAAFNEDPSLLLEITPVLKLDDEVKGQLRQQLAESGIFFDTTNLANSASGANAQTDEDRVKWSMLSADLASIKTAVEKGPLNAVTLSDVITAFKGMNIITDTGVLDRSEEHTSELQSRI